LEPIDELSWHQEKYTYEKMITREFLNLHATQICLNGAANGLIIDKLSKKLHKFIFLQNLTMIRIIEIDINCKN
jgi:hypothetical protein